MRQALADTPLSGCRGAVTSGRNPCPRSAGLYSGRIQRALGLRRLSSAITGVRPARGRLVTAAKRLRAGSAWSLALRLNNLTDEFYADRADFAFGEYRYFPGRGREIFFQVAYQEP